MFRSLLYRTRFGLSLSNANKSLPSLLAMFASVASLVFIISKLTPQHANNHESQASVHQVNSYYGASNKSTKRFPQAIIIGARKCGTRALLKFLEINSQIRAAPNEVHFFDRPDRYKRGLEWYREQMVESAANEISIEKSPSYFVTKGVAERIAAMNATVKLIIILRDPVVRLISDFSQIVSNKIELSTNNLTTREDVDEAWAEASKLFERHLFRPDGSLRDSWRAIQMGMYSKYLERWLNIFERNQIHFVDGEKLIRSPDTELQKVEVFLRLNTMISKKDFVFDRKKGFFCIAINQASNGNETKTRNQSEKSVVKAKCLSKHKGRRHINVSSDILNKLRQFYAPYNEYLFSLIGKRLAWAE